MVRANGHAVSDRLPPVERLSLVRTAASARGTRAGPTQFPPEFVFSPETGERLTPAASPTTAPWIPPFGAQVLRPGAAQAADARGLSRTDIDLRLTQRPRAGGASRRSAADDADRTLPAPPPGQYEFVVGRFGADVDMLLAIEPEKGALYVWLPQSARWEPLVHDGGGFLAEAAVPIAQWRAELFQRDTDTVLCLSTHSGLAVLRADSLALSYSVSYLGAAAAVGAPITWGGEVWAPLHDASGTLALIAVTAKGEVARLQKTSIQAPDEPLGAPVCDAQQVIWPGRSGQLVLRKGPDGAALCTWVAWPADMEPRFAFGCAYLSGTGRFWQLCWSRRDDAYVYVQMGRTGADLSPTNAPALCTGRRSYKMATLMKADPWQEPEESSDSQSNDAVIPILESTRQGVVLGLVVEAEGGVTTLLESRERVRAVVRLHSDKGSDVDFQTLIVPAPWRTRACVFDGCLWLYHPDLSQLVGTELEA